MKTIARKEVELNQCFPEDIEQYYTVATDYLNLAPEDALGAFELSKKAWVLADRWSAIQANSKKLATMHGVSKTELKDYSYQRYRQMQYIHEHCRMIYRIGENEVNQRRS